MIASAATRAEADKSLDGAETRMRAGEIRG